MMQDTQGVIVHDTPEEYVEQYMKAAKKILDKYAAKDPFFKKVLVSMQEWATLVVPYETKANGVYSKMGKAALDSGVVK
jgi:TRAP-type mannitol/chloroaromatic compound transport system substrate-binding protein